MDTTIDATMVQHWHLLSPAEKRSIYNSALGLKDLAETVIKKVKEDLQSGIEVEGCYLGKPAVTKTVVSSERTIDFVLERFDLSLPSVLTCVTVSYPKLLKLVYNQLPGGTQANKDKALQAILGDMLNINEKTPPICCE